MFARKPVKEFQVNADFDLSPWIDGDRQQMRIRQRYFMDVLNYYDAMQNRTATSTKVLRLLQGLQPQYDGHIAKTAMYHRFVDSKATKETIVVFTNVKPQHVVNFCHHLCLTLGTYVTELDFVGLGPLQALEKANLLTHPLVGSTLAQRMFDSAEIRQRYFLEEVR